MKLLTILFTILMSTSAYAHTDTMIYKYLCIEGYEYIQITDRMQIGFEVIPSPFEIDGKPQLYKCHLNDYKRGVEKFGKEEWEKIFKKAGYTENPYDIIDKYGREAYDGLDSLRMQGFCLTDEEATAFLEMTKENHTKLLKSKDAIINEYGFQIWENIEYRVKYGSIRNMEEVQEYLINM